MNKVILMGRLTKDPEVKYTQTGKVVTQFTLAVDRPFKDANGNKETDFIPVVVWGKAAELVGNSCQKGHRLLVDGRLQIRSYEAKDGSKRWVTEIIVNGVEFVERKSDKGGTSGDKSEFEQFGHAVPFDEDIPF
ncbi:single-stranded DNA-binding protein [Phascolarctobacterium faecium]|uniref:single-stranded DNA-binding protein n=1 Tax=Phascolarctobacterium faecium TaxID=33025 RepID=UPI003A9227CF